MRVFVAGASGAVGRPLVRQLIEAGHRVIGTTRSSRKADALRAAGAEPVILDAFDTDALRGAVEAARPEVVVNQLTALSAPFNPRRYGDWIAETNALRRDVAPRLVDAARAAGARRVVAQSIAFVTAPEGPTTLDEEARLYTDAPEPLGQAVRACVALERAVTRSGGIEGVVLRYGFFYGPGTSYAPGGEMVEQVRRRRFPIVGSGEGRFPFVHVEDAAAAAVAALSSGESGVYNIVDDEPARMRDWVRELARLLGAPRPLPVPSFLARLAAGHVGVYYATSLRGASNAKAARELGWRPERPSWRAGFREIAGAT